MVEDKDRRCDRDLCFHENTTKAHRRIRYCKIEDLISSPLTFVEDFENWQFWNSKHESRNLAFLNFRCIFAIAILT